MASSLSESLCAQDFEERSVTDPADTKVPSFANKIVCAKCGARGGHIDVAPELERTAPDGEPDWETVALVGPTSKLIGGLP